MCFAFYNAGVRDGDTGQLDKFNLAGEYDNNYCVFKQYFLQKSLMRHLLNLTKLRYGATSYGMTIGTQLIVVSGALWIKLGSNVWQV